MESALMYDRPARGQIAGDTEEIDQQILDLCVLEHLSGGAVGRRRGNQVSGYRYLGSGSANQSASS